MNARPLSEEDRILWSIVARTAVPLKPPARRREAPSLPVSKPLTAADTPPPSPSPSKPALQAASPPPAKRPPSLALDAPTHGKIARGRLPIEGRVDLHGLFQDQAHGLLLSFLRRAHAGGARHVLVITGKGASSGGEGVLRRAVPAWLATPPFRELVSGFDYAARSHGGTGALYVRLKRR